MNSTDARALLATAIPPGAGVWADIGAGEGTFTRALGELLGPGSRIYAVDRDQNAIRALSGVASSPSSTIIPVAADFTHEFTLPELGNAFLDGILFANALHFARNAAAVLTRLTSLLKPGGSAVFIEYDERVASQWVPYPIPPSRLPVITRAAGLGAPEIMTTRPSAFGGTLYVARAARAEAL